MPLFARYAEATDVSQARDRAPRKSRQVTGKTVSSRETAFCGRSGRNKKRFVSLGNTRRQRLAGGRPQLAAGIRAGSYAFKC